MEQKKNNRNGFHNFLKRKGLTQREAAKLLGTTTGNVGSLAVGRSNPGFDIQLKLIELGISSEELFGEKTAEILQKNDAEYRGSRELPPDIDALIEAKIRKIYGNK